MSPLIHLRQFYKINPLKRALSLNFNEYLHNMQVPELSDIGRYLENQLQYCVVCWMKKVIFTVLEDSLHIESISSTGFIVSASLEIIW